MYSGSLKIYTKYIGRHHIKDLKYNIQCVSNNPTLISSASVESQMYAYTHSQMSTECTAALYFTGGMVEGGVDNNNPQWIQAGINVDVW